jgi:hypothetical protein
MLFAIDCCAWIHIQDIFINLHFDLRPMIQNYKWGFTNAVQIELVNFHQETFVPFADANLIPVESKELERYLVKNPFLKEFDVADQTLLYTSKRDNNIVVTDDGGLYIEAQAAKIATFNLPQFCLYLVRDGSLERKKLNPILTYWEKKKCYRQKWIQKYREELNKL